MSKYIINNCPSCTKQDECIAMYLRTSVECKDRNDCVLKQIVEKCKKYIKNYNDKVFYDEDDVQILMGKVMLSQSILTEILDIQEVE